jgi:type IV pilus assembly protein PilV
MNTDQRISCYDDNGFTVVEVLVSLLILSVGLMGLASLQVVGLQNTQGGSQRAQAAYLAYDIADRMRSNTAAVTAGNYNFNGALIVAPPNCIGVAANCTTAQMATFDLAQWRNLISTYLTGGTATIAAVDVGTTTQVTVTVQWTDPFTVDAGNEVATFVTELAQ